MLNEQQLIASLARRYGVDPRAALAIASVEGGFHGSVGDNGTSFGPFQLHEGGALPAGRGNAWANSPAGIQYALQHIASVARGLHGRAAVSAISSRFERPANVPAEIAKAMGRYGGSIPSGGGGGGMFSPIASAAASGGGSSNDLILQLVQSILANNSSKPRVGASFQPIPIQYALGGSNGVSP